MINIEPSETFTSALAATERLYTMTDLVDRRGLAVASLVYQEHKDEVADVVADDVPMLLSYIEQPLQVFASLYPSSRDVVQAIQDGIEQLLQQIPAAIQAAGLTEEVARAAASQVVALVALN